MKRVIAICVLVFHCTAHASHSAEDISKIVNSNIRRAECFTEWDSVVQKLSSKLRDTQSQLTTTKYELEECRNTFRLFVIAGAALGVTFLVARYLDNKDKRLSRIENEVF